MSGIMFSTEKIDGIISLVVTLIAFATFTFLECIPLLNGILELHIAAVGFRQINDQVAANLDQTDLLDLKKWKLQYLLLCDYVAEWNGSLNYLLLVEICHILFNFVIQSYNIVMVTTFANLHRIILIYSTFTIIKNVINLLVLCLTANQVKDEVRWLFQFSFISIVDVNFG